MGSSSFATNEMLAGAVPEGLHKLSSNAELSKIEDHVKTTD